MSFIQTIRDEDLGLTSPSLTPPVWRERVAGRIVVFDTDGKVGLFHATAFGYHKLPGGGAERDEDALSAAIRETREEIGCEVTNVRELGAIEEYRSRFSLHQISHCFIANLAGEKGAPALEEEEITHGFETVWMDLDNAIVTVAAERGIDDYESKFIQMRDLIFLQEARKRYGGILHSPIPLLSSA